MALVVTPADAHLLHEANRSGATVTLRVAGGSAEQAARAALARGRRTLVDGPLGDAYASFTLAGALAGALAGPSRDLALAAHTLAADTAWAAGDRTACAVALEAALAVGAPTGQLADYLRGLTGLLREHPQDAIGPLRRVAADTGDAPDALHRAASAALLLGDTDAACRIGLRALAIARGLDRPGLVARALEYLAYAEMRAGRHARARAHSREGLDGALRTGRTNAAARHRAVLALSASVEGDAAEVESYAAASLETARRCGLNQTAALAEWALARSDLGRGDPAAAAARLADPVRQGHFAVRHLLLPCYAEAAALAGRETRTLTAELRAWAASGLDLSAPAQLARIEALTAPADTPPDRIEDAFRRAIRLHPPETGDFERARTQLHYGKWLRRRRRPLPARAVLRDALHGFERCGAAPWADQARQELRAAGDKRSPAPRALTGLTPHQLRIARLVATGATNREVAQSLSLSVRTVDHHLRNIFAALGIRSRVELTRIVADGD
ncbi:LuxR C-terminal-related transcriptional regulator [Glycomyces sp. NPDC047010]|uniref:LuxR C-terminal-related transcriptional regulator n=1 Tax=Glycomyces sp. NPDC047010 TaxID=3155023 RepID=UPI0033BFEA2B